MKRVVILASLLLCVFALKFHAQSFSRTAAFRAAAVLPQGISCAGTIEQTKLGESSSGEDYIQYFTGFIRTGMSFWASNTTSICSVDLVLKKYAVGGTNWVSIWSNSTDKPGSIIGGESAEFNGAALSTSFSTNRFLLPSRVSLTANTVYWIVVREKAHATAFGNTMVSLVSSTKPFGTLRQDVAVGTWGSSGETSAWRHALYE